MEETADTLQKRLAIENAHKEKEHFRRMELETLLEKNKIAEDSRRTKIETLRAGHEMNKISSLKSHQNWVYLLNIIICLGIIIIAISAFNKVLTLENSTVVIAVVIGLLIIGGTSFASLLRNRDDN